MASITRILLGILYMTLCLLHLIKVPYKKKELRDTLLNHSYSRISDYILNMTALNMILCLTSGLVLCMGYDALYIILDLVEALSLIICIS